MAGVSRCPPPLPGSRIRPCPAPAPASCSLAQLGTAAWTLRSRDVIAAQGRAAGPAPAAAATCRALAWAGDVQGTEQQQQQQRGSTQTLLIPQNLQQGERSAHPIPAHPGPAGGGSPAPLPGPATGGTVTKICPRVREQQQRECTSPRRQQPAFHAFFRGRGLVGHCSARGFAPAEPLRCQTHRGRRCLRGGEGPGTAVVRGLRGCPRLPGCGSQGCNVPTGPGNSPPEAAAKILAATRSRGAAAGRSRTNPQRAGSVQGANQSPPNGVGARRGGPQ